MKKFLIIFLLAALPAFVAAQDGPLTTKNKKAIKEYNEGRAYYDRFLYDDAISSFNLAIANDSKFVEAYIMLGIIYNEQRNYEKAIENYNKSLKIDPGFFPSNFYNVANLEIKTGKYEDALAHLQTFLKYNPKPVPKSQAEHNIEICKFAIDQIKNPKPFNPVAVGPGVNTEFSEYMPALTADEETMIFTRLVKATSESQGLKYQEDFYMSKHVDGQWSEAIPLGDKINSPLNEGSHSISPDGKTLYFTACNRESGKGQCDIYMSKLRKGEWDYPVNIQELNTTAWESQPSIAPDGKTMYFTSARDGGNYDLYVTTFDESLQSWTEPHRLPDNINTPGVEQTPFIHPDGKTLYFTSNGLLGMGGQDIYFTRKLTDSTWSDPVNLGYPINTFRDEACLYVNPSGEKAYYAAGRLDAVNTYIADMDIYCFDLYPEARPDPVTYMKGIVTDKISGLPLQASFELTDLSTEKVIAASSSDEKGSFLLCIPSGRDYMLNVSAEKYLFYSDNFNLTGVHSKTDPYIKNIQLQPATSDAVVVLNNIFFDTDKFDLKSESYAELDKLRIMLVSNPKMKIEIGGHTDNTGTKEHNKTLSENRAKAVVNYLVSKGIAASRMTYKGYGDTVPRDTNDTPEGRALNRRTEFKVISN